MKPSKLLRNFCLPKKEFDASIKIIIESDKGNREKIHNAICFDDIDADYTFQSLTDMTNNDRTEQIIYVKFKK